jgi:Zn-dependent M28 family amino/carboxypeptidase
MTVVWVVILVACIALPVAGWLAMIRMPGRSYAGRLPPLSGDELALRDRLAGHVRVLAGDIGERNLWQYEPFRAASTYLQTTFRELGYDVDVQAFDTMGRLVENIAVERRGGALAGEIVVIGAHYDSVAGSPGANDNATGVAALVELARAFSARTPARTVRFVAFANEEPPFFQTADMGSLHHARRAKARGERIVAMVSIETIGAYSDAPGSQQYPLPLFGWLYPDTADFITFVGNVDSRRLVRQAIGAFRAHAAFPSQGAAVPAWIPGVGWSDHWAFWQQGYPAIMVTDTALFRYGPYHTIADVPDAIDDDRMARVVSGLVAVIGDLAGGTTDATPHEPR